MLEQHVDVVSILERASHVCYETVVKYLLLVVEMCHHFDLSLDVRDAVLVQAVCFRHFLDSPVPLGEFVDSPEDLRIFPFTNQVLDSEPVDADFYRISRLYSGFRPNTPNSW